MINIIQTIRAYTLPMTILSWFVAFGFGYKNGGDILYGLIALVGICFAHLGVNVFDDFMDYKTLPKSIDENGQEILLNAQKGKCDVILKKLLTPNNMLCISTTFFILAIFVGVFFIQKVGFLTILFMVLAGILCLSYPILGRYRLCEIVLATIYGPLLFGGVFYVMVGFYDWHTILFALPTMLVTVNMLYTDTVLDYDIDKKEGKKTIANMFKTKTGSVTFQKILITCAYLSILLLYFMNLVNSFVLFTFLTIPFALNLINSMNLYIKNPNELPKSNIFDGLKENWKAIKEEDSESFMLRMYQARNFMVLFSVMFGLALFVGF